MSVAISRDSSLASSPVPRCPAVGVVRRAVAPLHNNIQVIDQGGRLDVVGCRVIVPDEGCAEGCVAEAG